MIVCDLGVPLHAMIRKAAHHETCRRAYLAALALEHGCEWWTTDAGFHRFPGLRWRNLIA